MKRGLRRVTGLGGVAAALVLMTTQCSKTDDVGGASGDAARSRGDAAVDAGAGQLAGSPCVRFDLKDKSTVQAGQCAEGGQGLPELADGVAPESWQRIYVDQAAAEAAGDGTRAAPFATLAQAVERAGDQPAAIVLAPGEYEGPVEARASLVLTGAGAATTTIQVADGARPVVRAVGVRRLVVDGLHIAGGQRGVSAEQVAQVVIRQSRLTGAAQAGLVVQRVAAALVVDSVVSEVGGRHIVAMDSALAVRRSVVGPGPGHGLLATAAPDGVDVCEAAPKPGWCPFRGYIILEQSLVRGVGEQGVSIDRGVLRMRRSRIEKVTELAPETNSSPAMCANGGVFHEGCQAP